MKSTRKGNDLEKMAKEYLEEEGFKVHRAIRSFTKLPSGRSFMRSNDIFGCFDLIALSLVMAPRFIQVTTKAGLYARKKKIDAKFPKGALGAHIEVWAWHGGTGRMYFAIYNAIYNHDSGQLEWTRELNKVMRSDD